MDAINLSHNIISIYMTIQRFTKALIGFTFFTLLLLAILSIGELLLFTSTSLLFNDYFLDYNWIANLFPAILLASIVYATITAPLDIITNQLILSDDSFTKTSGMLFKKEITIPYACIDSIESKQSPLQKIFNFTTLKFTSDAIKKSSSGLLSTTQAREIKHEVAHRSALAHMYRYELENIDTLFLRLKKTNRVN